MDKHTAAVAAVVMVVLAWICLVYRDRRRADDRHAFDAPLTCVFWALLASAVSLAIATAVA
jgi:hypothetical protein